MNQDISERDYLRPGNLGVSVLQPLGQSRRGLADNRELLNDGATFRYKSSRRIQKPRFFEHGSPDHRLQPVLRDQIDFSPEKVRQI